MWGMGCLQIVEFGERETGGQKGLLVINHRNRPLVSVKYNFNNQEDTDAEQFHPFFSVTGGGSSIGRGGFGWDICILKLFCPMGHSQPFAVASEKCSKGERNHFANLKEMF